MLSDFQNREFSKIKKDELPNLTVKLFKDLDIGEIFTAGFSDGIGANKGNYSCTIYKKITKSKAEIIAEPGRFNNRYLRTTQIFSYHSRVSK